MKTMKTATPLPVVEMVGEFQCPGCTCGGKNTMDDCGNIEQSHGMPWTCSNHSAGTMMFPGGKIMLGLPRGFNKVGLNRSAFSDKQHNPIRLWPKDGHPPKDFWDHLNVAVWATEENGHLFVRTYSPRINVNWIDVIEGGTLEMVPNAINVAEFVDEIS